MTGRRGTGPGSERGERDVADDVRREVEAHLALRVDELVAAGWDPEEARREALSRFGDVEEVEAAMRKSATGRRAGWAQGWSRWVEALVQDVRYAVRALTRSPGFAALAVLTLALGIGANTAVFSIVNGVLLRPLPFPRPERLAFVAERNNRGGPMAAAWPNLKDWKERSRTFEALAGYSGGTTTVLGGLRPLRARATSVGAGFWDVLDVRPELGRVTLPEEHREGVAPVVVLSHRFWQDQLGGDPDVLERTLEVEGHAAQVVGVMPPAFDFPDETALWWPAELEGENDSRTSHNWKVVGRLAPGADVEGAREELAGITAQVLEGSTDDPDYLATGVFVTPLLEQIAGSARRPLYLLLGAAAVVLLVACSNLASTLLARGASRAREMAVRASLGAPRSRLVRQLLTESLVLAGAGAAAGLGLAWLVLRGLVALGPAALPRLGDVSLDGRVLAFTAVLSLATSLLFGTAPALRIARGSVAGALREGGRGAAAEGTGALWRLLVGGEVALALLLLAGSGLLIRSFWRVLDQDPGFRAGDVLAADISPSPTKYPDDPSTAAFYDRLLAQLNAAPGVASAAVTTTIPLAGGIPSGRMQLDGDMSLAADGGYVVVSGGYFELLGIPLLQGRTFTEGDDASSAQVAVVSRSFAERWWPGRDPLGHQVTGGGMDNFWNKQVFATVVGVVGDVRYRGLTRDPTPTVYFSYRQRPFRTRYGTTLLTRPRVGSAEVAAGALRGTVQTVDPDIPLTVRPLAERVGESVADRRFTLIVLGAFAAVALLLAVVGIYGVVSYSVARRTREVGIRLALGAQPGAVRGLVMREAVGTAAAGLVVGAGAALALGRVMQGLLFEVSPRDPSTLVAGVLLLAGAALLASWIPARRSTRIDPMITMRAE